MKQEQELSSSNKSLNEIALLKSKIASLQDQTLKLSQENGCLQKQLIEIQSISTNELASSFLRDHEELQRQFQDLSLQHDHLQLTNLELMGDLDSAKLSLALMKEKQCSIQSESEISSSSYSELKSAHNQLSKE